MPHNSSPAQLTFQQGILSSYEPFYLAEIIPPQQKWLHVVASEDRAQDLKKTLEFLGLSAGVLTGWDIEPYSHIPPSLAVMAQRIELMYQKPQVIIATAASVLQRLPWADQISARTLTYIQGQKLTQADLCHALTLAGYESREAARRPGEFARRGGLVDVFPTHQRNPVRLDFFGDFLESLREFDPLSQCCSRDATNLETLTLLPAREDIIEEQVSVIDCLQPASVSLAEPALAVLESYAKKIVSHFLAQDVPKETALYLTLDDLWSSIPQKILGLSSLGSSQKVKAGFDFVAERHTGQLFPTIAQKLRAFRGRVLVCGNSPSIISRIQSQLKENSLPSLRPLSQFSQLASLQPGEIGTAVLPLDQGFQTDDLLVVTQKDIFGNAVPGPKAPTAQKKQISATEFLREANPFEAGDYVVHPDNGIGQYQSLETVSVNSAPHDCLVILYEGGDKLFLPVENIQDITRYGPGHIPVPLDKLGTAAWQNRQAQVKKRIRVIAQHLLDLAAKRATHRGEIFSPPNASYEAFCSRFPYLETPDQNQAIEATLEDIASGKPMDRLICGDVGFGKTEVALRAAFVVAASGSQVAVITPTTLLARQHFQKFQERFEGTGLQVAQLSRLTPSSQAKVIRAGLANGDVNIVVATSSLLASSVQFSQLGLLIVDEEQHFGVAQKEKLKHLKECVHLLTLTATPIPRTLQLALSGVREMSLMATPPQERKVPQTFVLPFDPQVLRAAILREKERDGQAFYVCPRIEDLAPVQADLEKFVPEARVSVVHGQLKPSALEKVMEDFTAGQFDVLLSTNIVESGIDIPKANTLIVHRADWFGLAQLYQLRGRIGRSSISSYAYLTLPKKTVPSPQAVRRLEVLQSLDHLGAGFTLASHDMDIRGAGNLVGAEQSGHIREVGIELYQNLLEESIQQMKEEPSEPARVDWSPHLNLGVPVLIPEGYVKDLTLRLGLYRRLGHVQTEEEIEDFAVELKERFGPLPQEVQNLLLVMSLKQLCRKSYVSRIERGSQGTRLSFYQDQFPDPQKLLSWVLSKKDSLRLRADHKLIWSRSWRNPEMALLALKKLLQEIVLLTEIKG